MSMLPSDPAKQIKRTWISHMIDGLETIGKKELRELLTKSWMTHDAMWFMHSIETFGIEKANEVNIAAVRSMSSIEIKRLQKALGYSDCRFSKFNDLVEFIQAAFGLVKADFMQFRFDVPDKNTLRWKWTDGKCFAYEGVKALGFIREYRCGIMKRIEGWLHGLGVAYQMDPAVDRCLMNRQGSCAGCFKFDLE